MAKRKNPNQRADDEAYYEDEQEAVPAGANLATVVAVMANDVKYVKRQLTDIQYQVSDHYVTKEEFEPVRKLVYGVVGLVLLTVVGLLLSLVVHR